MLVKIFGCVLIALTGLGVGCIFTKRLSQRLDFMSKLRVFISLLQTQIRYNSSDIYSLVISSAKSSDLPLFSQDDIIEPFSEFWKAGIINNQKKFGLNNSDLELLFEFGSGLGATDIEGQLSHLELYQSIFQKRLQECQSEFKDKSKIYRALGLFGGISTALIIL